MLAMHMPPREAQSLSTAPRKDQEGGVVSPLCLPEHQPHVTPTQHKPGTIQKRLTYLQPTPDGLPRASQPAAA
jgi:hypothetical protein